MWLLRTCSEMHNEVHGMYDLNVENYFREIRFLRKFRRLETVVRMTIDTDSHI